MLAEGGALRNLWAMFSLVMKIETLKEQVQMFASGGFLDLKISFWWELFVSGVMDNPNLDIRIL